MRKKVLIALAGISAAACFSARAADFEITFYGQTDPGRTDQLGGYQSIFTGSISVKDSAVAPNAFVSWYGGDITGASFKIAGQNIQYSFDLGIDLFPPLSNQATANPTIQGLRFDAQGRPLRIDIPATSFCSSCTPLKDLGSYPGRNTTGYPDVRPYLEFIDDDTFDIVVQPDGYLNYARNVPNPVLILAGRWVFESGYIPNQLENERLGGFYAIAGIATPPVPEPGTMAMMALGMGILAVARRSRRGQGRGELPLSH